MTHAPWLKYFCCTCGSTGPRSDSYRELKRECPGYEDVCASCGGDDVEVFDERYAKPGQFAAEVFTGGDVT